MYPNESVGSNNIYQRPRRRRPRSKPESTGKNVIRPAPQRYEDYLGVIPYTKKGTRVVKSSLRGGRGKSLVASSLVYALQAVPGAGVVAIPAYTAYNCLRLGHALYKLYSEGQRETRTTATQFKEATGEIVDYATAERADVIVDTLISKARQTRIIDEVAKRTGISSIAYSEMLKGSISLAISHGFGGLTKFAVSKVVGV